MNDDDPDDRDGHPPAREDVEQPADVRTTDAEQYSIAGDEWPGQTHPWAPAVDLPRDATTPVTPNTPAGPVGDAGPVGRAGPDTQAGSVSPATNAVGPPTSIGYGPPATWGPAESAPIRSMPPPQAPRVGGPPSGSLGAPPARARRRRRWIVPLVAIAFLTALIAAAVVYGPDLVRGRSDLAETAEECGVLPSDDAWLSTDQRVLTVDFHEGPPTEAQRADLECVLEQIGASDELGDRIGAASRNMAPATERVGGYDVSWHWYGPDTVRVSITMARGVDS